MYKNRMNSFRTESRHKKVKVKQGKREVSRQTEVNRGESKISPRDSARGSTLQGCKDGKFTSVGVISWLLPCLNALYTYILYTYIQIYICSVKLIF